MKKFENCIKDSGTYAHYLRQTNKVGIALSGGVDSMVLYDLIKKAQLRNHQSLSNIFCIHFNHHLRPESNDEYQAVKQLVESDGVHFIGIDLDVETYCNVHKVSLEQGAHDLRYAHFNRLKEEEQIHTIFLGHHGNDLTESILMRFVSGAFSQSLIGMTKTFYKDGIHYMRPFLPYTKEMIYHYAHTHNIPYFEDASNNSHDYTRNRYRHEIVPILTREQPNLTETMYRYMEDKANEEDYFATEVSAFIQRNVDMTPLETFEHAKNPYAEKLPVVRLLKSAYGSSHPAIKKRVFYHLLKTFAPDATISHKTFAAFSKLSFEHTSDIIALNKDIQLYMDQDYVVFMRVTAWNALYDKFRETYAKTLVPTHMKARTVSGNRIRNALAGMPIALKKRSFMETDAEGKALAVHTPFRKHTMY